MREDFAKVLVIGSYTEYGADVVQHLLENGHKVFAFDRLRMPQDYPGYAGDDSPRAIRFLGDIRDGSAVTEAVSIVDGVIHLGSLDDTEIALDNPAATIEFNILGALNVFQACRLLVRRCVYLTPNSMFEASTLAFLFNEKHNTEIAVVKFSETVHELLARPLAEKLVGCLIEDHYQYSKPFVYSALPRLQEATT